MTSLGRFAPRPALPIRALALKWLAFFAMLGFLLAANARDAARTRIDFVYFGSPDCPYCRGWEAHDLAKLERSRLFRRVHFTKISKALGSPVPPASAFPKEIKQLRDPIAQSLIGAGSPMFAILSDGHVVTSWRGAKKYSPDQILEIIARQQPFAASASGTAVGLVLAR